MKRYIEIIMDKESFSVATAEAFIHSIGEGLLSENEIAGVLTGIQFRGVTLEELDGFRKALLDRAVVPELDSSESIDVCGTGGDGKDTFNISTTTALVLAAMGYKVIKHGNYGVSSTCGSSNVLESLGFQFKTNEGELAKDLKHKNICFLHAPLFHPTLKRVAPIRKSLGVRTLFNSLGPLVNPVQPVFQLTGTYSLELAKMYQHLLRRQRTGFAVVHAMDGYDEITLTDAARLLSKNNDTLIGAEHMGVASLSSQDLLSGGNIREAKNILLNITRGQGSTAQNTVVAANTAVAMQTIAQETNLKTAFTEALQFIRSGQTAKHFNL